MFCLAGFCFGFLFCYNLYMKRVLFLILLIFLLPKLAQGYVIDFDKDGLSDKEEISVYFTDPAKADTDGDGYLDGDEIKHHYSPHFPNLTLSGSDLDGDGLSDWLELLFHTNLKRLIQMAMVIQILSKLIMVMILCIEVK